MRIEHVNWAAECELAGNRWNARQQSIVSSGFIEPRKKINWLKPIRGKVAEILRGLASGKQ